MNNQIKKPSDTDYAPIKTMLDRAFAPSISESELVKKLQYAGKISFDLIIGKNDRVLAYICYTAAYDSQGAKIGHHLAPLGVLPERQRQGLGQMIVRESLKLLPEGQPVYVLGDPEYYKRFGFRKDRTQKCGFDPEGNHFMALFDGSLPPREVFYEKEFYEVG